MAAPHTAEPAPRPRRRWVRRLAIGGAAVLVLVLLIVALTPTIAGWIAPGYIERSIAKSINGTVAVQRTAFSWFGNQHVGPVVLRDDRGGEVIRASVDVTRGLTGLTGGAIGVGSLDVGEVRVNAAAQIIREPDGTINIQRLFAKERPVRQAPPPPRQGPPPPPPEPTRVPPSLAAKVIIEDLDLVFEDRGPGADPGARVVRLTDAKGEGFFAPGQPITFSLTGAATYAPDMQAPGSPAGEVRVNGTVNDLVDSTGLVTVDRATFDAAFEATNLAVAPADALTRMKGALIEGLGERVNVTVTAKGTPSDATADVKAAAPGLDADLALRYVEAGGTTTLSAARPGTIRVQMGALRALVPGFKEALDKQSIATVTTWPDVAIALENLNLRLPRGAAGPDLRGSSVALRVNTTEMAGEVVTPGTEGQGAGARQPFTLAPFNLSIESKDLAGSVRARGEGSATIGDQPAGSLVIDMSAGGLLDQNGQPVAGLPRVLNGTVLLKGVSTVLAQPLVDAAGLDLPQDVGPTLDVDLRARARATEGEPSTTIPATNIDLAVRATKVQMLAALDVDASGIRGREVEGRPAIDATVASAPAIAGRLAERAGAARIRGSGPLKVAVSGLSIPFAPGGNTPAFDQAAARATIATTNLTVLPLYPGADPQAPPTPPDAPPVQVQSLQVAGVLTPGAEPRATIDSQLAHGESAFTINGDSLLQGLLQPGEAGAPPTITPSRARPIGTLAIANAPTSLARLMPGAPRPAQGEPAPTDIPRLIQDAVGPTVSVNVETGVARARADRLNVITRLQSEGVSGVITGGLLSDALALDRSDLRASVTPRLADSLLAVLAPTLDPRPTLTEAGVLTIALEPLRIPLVAGGFRPDFANTGDLTARVGLEGRMLLENVQVRNEDGSVRDVGAVGVEGMSIIVAAPMKALAAKPDAGGVSKASIKARLLAGTPAQRFADLDVTAEAPIANMAPSGPIAATLKITEASTVGLDRLMQSPGLYSGALGSTLSVDATAKVQLARGAAPGAPPYERINVSASLAAPLLAMPQPMKATLTPDRMALDSAAVMNWTMDPSFGDAQVLGLPPRTDGAEAPAPAARFTAPTRMKLSIARLALGSAARPLRPDIFALDATVDAPEITMDLGDGTPARFGAMKMRVGNLKQPGALAFSMGLDAAQNASTGAAPVDVSGGLMNVADETGKLTPERAILNAKVNANSFPTALVDAMARQGGFLLELLGPTVTLDAQAGALPLRKTNESGGSLTATMKSPRAAADLKGDLRNGAFVAREPLTTSLTEITPALGQRLGKGMPLVATFSKSPKDGAATLTAKGLSIPIDGDLRKLNGDFTFNLGLVHFETSGRFQKILKVFQQRQSGLIGQNIEPFVATVKEGVITYDRYKLPVGEFSVETMGTVNLVDRSVDVITWIPLGALTDEAAGVFNTNLGKLMGNLPIIEQTTLLPWRTHGSLDNPRTEPDLEAYVKGLGRRLRPGELLRDIGDKIRGNGGGGAGGNGGGGAGGGR